MFSSFSAKVIPEIPLTYSCEIFNCCIGYHLQVWNPRTNYNYANKESTNLMKHFYSIYVQKFCKYTLPISLMYNCTLYMHVDRSSFKRSVSFICYSKVQIKTLKIGHQLFCNYKCQCICCYIWWGYYSLDYMTECFQIFSVQIRNFTNETLRVCLHVPTPSTVKIYNCAYGDSPSDGQNGCGTHSARQTGRHRHRHSSRGFLHCYLMWRDYTCHSIQRIGDNFMVSE